MSILTENGEVLLIPLQLVSCFEQKCPFDAIEIINLPKDLDKDTTHRYGPNTFKLHRFVASNIGITSVNVLKALIAVPLSRPTEAANLPACVCAFLCNSNLVSVYAFSATSGPSYMYRLPVPRPGQVLGLVGTNGIGKSTALKVLAGKLKPNLGRFDVSKPIPLLSLCCAFLSRLCML